VTGLEVTFSLNLRNSLILFGHEIPQVTWGKIIVNSRRVKVETDGQKNTAELAW